ncbi:hypothetical protein M2451_002257 [Dysgonomonas sp. PFB1-18]|uniref:hypothetical protein n=1 Tax=unclassified Dysgonomonas TaxID=2630389 RepID=UPI0024748206|nr:MULTISPECIES: hypothetical protein [unclassified Dysgonomonas]MDH6309886.1 hypothetical protein [Dysgonomonas sp. PF1-14]MDH6339430.1 hypothetical protein [Dysgonomonas sp. PF1-16]MDH6380929.1 hypothetical protein [Dysgonomonas sp. PFB1-18]MDH6397938.1 hypothetical protein [Dysgonomonas sp. PF1-23]
MKQDDYAKLEKDQQFKKDYLNRTMWWKSVLMVPPVCFLFVGLVGILYLYKQDLLISWYITPYLILFVIGTVWLKAIKKHIQKTKMEVDGAFRVCLASPVGEKGGYTYLVYANDSHRHNKYYVKTLAKDIDFADLSEKYTDSVKKKQVSVQNSENNESYYVVAYKTKDVEKCNKDALTDEIIPLLYIDDNNTLIIKKKDLIG